MNYKEQTQFIEIENRINEVKRQLARGETDMFSVNSLLEEYRLVRLFLAADIKQRFQTRPNDTFIESFCVPSQLAPIAQITSPSVVSVLDEILTKDTLGDTWYLEFDDAMALHPDCHILTPVRWQRIPEELEQAAKNSFGTDIVTFFGCTDPAKMAAIAEVAKQRIQTLGALPWIRFTTLGAFRFAYFRFRQLTKAAA